jgi:hypothetical protein
MDLELQGQRVIRETIDFAVSLRTDAGYEIRIETDFSMHTREGNFTFPLDVGLEREEFHSLLNQVLISSTAEESGTLTLAFADGTTIRVEPNETYEAWTIAGPRGRKIVCMPHGELASWPEIKS